MHVPNEHQIFWLHSVSFGFGYDSLSIFIYLTLTCDFFKLINLHDSKMVSKNDFIA